MKSEDEDLVSAVLDSPNDVEVMSMVSAALQSEEYDGTQSSPPSPEDCEASEDGDHCAHWYTGDPCCHCRRARLREEQGQ